MLNKKFRKRRIHRSAQRSKMESLEDRMMLSASPVVRLSLTAHPADTVSGSPQNLSPAMIQQAYDLNSFMFSTGGQSVAPNGAGETIAIVDAYADPNIASDLRTFDANFGISDNSSNGQFALTVATPEGAVGTDSGWAAEETLDVEWAHAIAPGAKILLVEAPSASFSDLTGAVTWATSQSGVVAVTMSWGNSPEFAGETSYDPVFTTPAGHQGITYVAAAGDDPVPNYPSTSRNVLAVGGTTLNVDSSGNWLGESYWTSGGGGHSPYEGTNKPDVAYDADPNTGYLVYDSIPNQGNVGWQIAGGTSAGSPQWAAIIAIADQGRALRGLGSLDGVSQTIPDLYAMPASDFNVVSPAGLTGLGSPIGARVISALVGGGIAVGPPAQLAFAQEPSNATIGQAISPSIKVDVEDASGNVVGSDGSTVTLSVGSGPGGLSGTLTATAVGGVATFSNISASVAGTYTLNATDGSLQGATSSGFTVAAGKLVFVQEPSGAVSGTAISPAIKVAVENSSGSIIGNDNSTVSLSVASGPGALSGTVNVQAVNGVATFSNVVLKTPGSYTLNASDGSDAGATSSGIVITAPTLAFLLEPSNAIAGVAVSPEIEVAVLNPGGGIDTSDNSNVTLSVASGPGSPGGTLTVQAVNGVATFRNVILNTPGSYILNASDGSDVGATSTRVVVAAPQLVFLQQPGGTIAGFTLAPVSVAIESSIGSVVGNDDANVTLSVASGPGSLGGAVTVAAVNGVATFRNLVLDTLGQYRLAANSGSATGVTSAAVTMFAPGSVDASSMNDISGWAFDPTNPSASVNIEVVISGGPTQMFLADLSRSDLKPFIGSSNHGYYYATPVLSAGNHTAQIYAIETNGTKVLLGTETLVSQNSLFDEHYYLEMNPDVASAVAKGVIATGYDHYLKYGQYEGRSPSPFWDEAYYLQSNPDVAAAVKDGAVSSGFMHYYLYGQYQNRAGLLYFNTSYYLANNLDVAAAVKAGTIASAFEHFVLYGQYEGRSPMLYFSSSVYDAVNPDILSAVTGESCSSDFEQFVEFGQHEDRIASDYYNEKIYLADNPDVAAAVAHGLYPDGFQHWLMYGQYEGRKAV
jgi:hypothetical protein